MNASMRFAAGALLALGLAPAAHAGDELYLRWDNCFGDGGVYNKVFACDTNSGTEALVASFRLAATTDSIGALEINVDLGALGPAIPAWWSMRATNPMGCRPTSLAIGSSPPATSTTCLDGWFGASTGVSEDPPVDNWPYVHIKALVGVPASNSITAEAGQEVFAFQLLIRHLQTVGSGSCGGCITPMCIAWDYARVSRVFPLAAKEIIGANTPQNGSNVTWQPGAVATTGGACFPNRPCDYYVTCQSVTPAHGSTWGSIKSLYR